MSCIDLKIITAVVFSSKPKSRYQNIHNLNYLLFIGQHFLLNIAFQDFKILSQTNNFQSNIRYTKPVYLKWIFLN